MQKILYISFIIVLMLMVGLSCIPFTAFFVKEIDKQQSKSFKLQKVINPTVTIKYKGLGGGSGTCIYKEQTDINTIELYFLTANHVADIGMYNFGYDFDNNNYRPLFPTFDAEKFLEQEIPQLIVEGWIYDNKHKVKKSFINNGLVYKMWKEIDTAVVKVIASPHDLITQIPVAELENVTTFDGLQPGHPVICSGCPYLLPPIVSKGHIGRKNFNDKSQLMGELNRVCLVRVNIAGGASGGGIYNYQNMKLIGIVSLGWGRNAFICGMIPISDIIPKLRKTYLGQRIGLEDSHVER